MINTSNPHLPTGVILDVCCSIYYDPVALFFFAYYISLFCSLSYVVNRLGYLS